jgi:cell division septal protein FtsQ
MKKRTVIAIALLILLTTITTQQKIVISKFNLKKIDIENNFLLEDKDIKKLLASIYNKNLIFLKNTEVQTALMQNSFIESFNIKKKYPSTLKIKIFETKPVAILFSKKGKFYLNEKIELIEFKKFPNYQNLPNVFGNKEEFKIFYNNLIKTNFPLEEVKTYILFEGNRWDLEINNNKIIKLPSKNYIKSLKNYINLKDKTDFKKYKLFDYRIKNQLILK